jgi:hypothetical protein
MMARNPSFSNGIFGHDLVIEKIGAPYQSFTSGTGAGEDGARHSGKSDGVLCATKATAVV